MNPNQTRANTLKKLREEKFDLVIIGGGITGAGIALDAVTRGMKTALVERHDFAYGTSSRSTKLIHGGLRYLKQLEFGLVREVGSERAIVHRLAPHLVIPEKMLMPLSEKSMSPWIASIGLKVYDWLANVAPPFRRIMLNQSQTLRREPLLQKDQIKSGALYVEYRTDDARLTLEIIKTASLNGAIVSNYVKAIDFLYDEDKISGVRCNDVERPGAVFDVPGQVVVNAAGPWVDDLRELNRSATGKRLRLTKGVHLVVKKKRLPVKQAIYFDAPDGRMIFVIPRGGVSYIGTTDTNCSAEPEDVAADHSDVAYLIGAVNAMFPQVRLTAEDIKSSWAGLRPLIHEEGKNPSQLSRKDEIFESPTGLLSIAGGKLTAYRKMAERVVSKVEDKLGSKFGSCRTSRLPLSGGLFAGTRQVARYIVRLKGALPKLGLQPKLAVYLVSVYGRQTEAILERVMRQPGGLPPELALIRAEVEYCVEYEWVRSARDFLIRRTGLLFFDIEKAQEYSKDVLGLLANRLSWDEARARREEHELQHEFRKAMIKT